MTQLSGEMREQFRQLAVAQYEETQRQLMELARQANEDIGDVTVTQLYSLLTQASQKYSVASQPVISGAVKSWETPTNIALLYSNNVTAQVPAVRMSIQQPGIYHLQGLVRGIASESIRFKVTMDTGWSLFPERSSDESAYFPASQVFALFITLLLLAGTTKYASWPVMVFSIGIATIYMWIVFKGGDVLTNSHAHSSFCRQSR